MAKAQRRICIALLTLAISCASCNDTSRQNTSTPSEPTANIPSKLQLPTATVFPNRCEFAIPIKNIDQKWVWGVTEADTCEYSWQVTINAGNDVYQLGFTYFNPDAAKMTGSFADLLGAGQTDIWKLEDDGLGASNVGSLNASTDGKRLLFVVEDQIWVEHLFSDKPQTVTFETGGTQLAYNKQESRVEYVDEL